MDSVTYMMATKQLSNLRNLERTSNNIANSNTTGFKEDEMVFDQFLVKDKNGKTAYGTDLYSVSNFTQGALKTTFRQLDVAIEGDGFFVINTPQGLRYTRDGRMHMDSERRLVNSSGFPFTSADGQEIIIGEEDTKLIIGDEGSIQSGPNIIGNLGIVEFDQNALLRKEGNGLFFTEQNPQEVENSRVLQGVLEDSNVNPVVQISSLIELNREAAITNGMINENFSLQRSAFKAYSKTSGGG